jgi:hypothetical protein
MFIEINGVILDKREHDRKVILLKRLMQYELSEVTRKYGFVKKKEYFFHEETGIKVKLLFEEPERKPL